ncbi:MAG: efflux RND transporter periplasmic adaptor subunit [Planctomycetota bacterium]
MNIDKLRIDRGRGPRLRRRWSWLPPLVTVAIGIGLLGLFRAPLRRQLDRWTLLEVEVVTAARASAAAAAAVAGKAANGYVVAAKKAALSADTPGRVVEMNVVEGTFVRTGDVVARLYSEEYEAALRRAEAEIAAAQAGRERAGADVEVARLDLERRLAEERAAAALLASAEADAKLAERELARYEKLVAEGIEDESALDTATAAAARARAAVEAQRATLEARQASRREGEAQHERAVSARAESEAQVGVAEAAAALARATLEKTFVRAPFDGIVVLKDAEVGEVVSPNSQGGNSRGSVATLVDLESLEVQIDLPETLLPEIEAGAPARIFLDAFPSEPYAGRVLRIWPTANRQKATIEIRVGFDAPDGRLRPDLGARVVFGTAGSPEAPPDAGPEGSPAQPVLVPSSAVVHSKGQTGVFLLERDVVRWQPVTTGEESGGRMAVEAGLTGGERIVADPPAGLEDGDRVRIASA